MRITLEPTTDGRWQIWAGDVEEWEPPIGMWLHTARPELVPGLIRRLLKSVSAADSAAWAKRTKGAGG